MQSLECVYRSNGYVDCNGHIDDAQMAIASNRSSRIVLPITRSILLYGRFILPKVFSSPTDYAGWRHTTRQRLPFILETMSIYLVRRRLEMLLYSFLGSSCTYALDVTRTQAHAPSKMLSVVVYLFRSIQSSIQAHFLHASTLRPIFSLYASPRF